MVCNHTSLERSSVRGSLGHFACIAMFHALPHVPCMLSPKAHPNASSFSFADIPVQPGLTQAHAAKSHIPVPLAWVL